MSAYSGRHAELYDVFYADKPYDKEAAFVHQCLQQHSIGTTHRILELACGTGSHAMALETKGYKILATDYSMDMLACARRKAAQVRSEVVFCHCDMRILDLPYEPFDAVICLFDSVGYVATNEALVQVLEGVHRHLRSNGLFVFEFWHAGAMLRHHDPLRVRRFSTPDGEVLRISQTALDYAKQLSRVTYIVYELRRDGTYTNFQETQINRYFLVQEVAGWLSNCGFTPLKWFNGFNGDDVITDQTWHVVAVAQRNKQIRYRDCVQHS